MDGDLFVLDDDFRTFTPDVAAAWENLEPTFEMFELYYGSKAIVLAHGTPVGKVVMDTYGAATLQGSPSGAIIDAAEATDMLDMAAGATLDIALVQRARIAWLTCSVTVPAATVTVDWLKLPSGSLPSGFQLMDDSSAPLADGKLILTQGKSFL